MPARTSNAPATGAERIVVGRPGWTERATQRGGKRESKRTRKKANALFGIHMVFGMIENRSSYTVYAIRATALHSSRNWLLPIKAL